MGGGNPQPVGQRQRLCQSLHRDDIQGERARSPHAMRSGGSFWAQKTPLGSDGPLSWRRPMGYAGGTARSQTDSCPDATAPAAALVRRTASPSVPGLRR